MQQLTVRLHTTTLMTVRFSFSQNKEISQRQKNRKLYITKTDTNVNGEVNK